MAHVLVVTAGLPSLVYPSIELARRLALAGHHVTFAGQPDASRLAAHHGLGFLALEPGRYEAFLRADGARPVVTRLRSLRERRRQAARALAVHAFGDVLRDRRPDVVLINGEMHEHIITASSAGVRLALLNSFVSIWRRPGLPPPHCLARPGVGWRGTRPGTALLWLALRARKQGKRWFDWAHRLGCDRVSVLGELARETGFDFATETDSGQWLIPFTYRRLPVLSLHAQEFEFPHQPPPHVRYVGPMVLESRIDRTLAAADQARLDDVLERRRRSGSATRIIYAGFGSVFTAGSDVLPRLLRLTADRPEWELIVSLGNRVPVSSVGVLPRGVHAFPWVPQLDVLRHADVAVTHGGINTIDECVLNGVPVLVYCGGETDMAGTSSRVVHHGIGIAGDPRRDGTAAMREHVDRLLADAAFRENIGRLQARYRAYHEDRVAERTIEALLAERAAGGRAHARAPERRGARG